MAGLTTFGLAISAVYVMYRLYAFLSTLSRVGVVPHVRGAHPLLGHMREEAALGQYVAQEQ